VAGGSRFGRLCGANVTRQMWLKCVPVVKKQGFTVFSFILILAPFELLFWSAFQLSWRVCLPLGLSWVPSRLPCWSSGASPGAHGDTRGSSWGARRVSRCIWGHIFTDFVGVRHILWGFCDLGGRRWDSLAAGSSLTKNVQDFPSFVHDCSYFFATATSRIPPSKHV
jgi:hypothetical protein